MSKLQNRRQFIRNLIYVTVGITLFGCEDEGGDTPPGDETGNNEAPVWLAIPAQSWTVGVPVYIDLNDYVTDPDGDALSIYLDKALPDGVTLNGTVISGTPTAVMASAAYVATADDGQV